MDYTALIVLAFFLGGFLTLILCWFLMNLDRNSAEVLTEQNVVLIARLFELMAAEPWKYRELAEICFEEVIQTYQPESLDCDDSLIELGLAVEVRGKVMYRSNDL